MNRIVTFRLYLLGLFTLFRWPLSHWVYPDWYHRLLGFEAYDHAPAKVMGTVGVVPVSGTLLATADPLRNRDFVLALVVFCVLMAVTYNHLNQNYGFPVREYINVALVAGNGALLATLYPWKAAA